MNKHARAPNNFTLVYWTVAYLCFIFMLDWNWLSERERKRKERISSPSINVVYIVAGLLLHLVGCLLDMFSTFFISHLYELYDSWFRTHIPIALINIAVPTELGILLVFFLFFHTKKESIKQQRFAFKTRQIHKIWAELTVHLVFHFIWGKEWLHEQDVLWFEGKKVSFLLTSVP